MKFEQDLNAEASKLFLEIDAQKTQLQNSIQDLEARQRAILVGAGIPLQGITLSQVEGGIVRVSREEEEEAPAKLEAVA